MACQAACVSAARRSSRPTVRFKLALLRGELVLQGGQLRLPVHDAPQQLPLTARQLLPLL
jgi:hypothetical protein